MCVAMCVYFFCFAFVYHHHIQYAFIVYHMVSICSQLILSEKIRSLFTQMRLATRVK